MKKRILSTFLALAMCLSLLPTSAFAVNSGNEAAVNDKEYATFYEAYTAAQNNDTITLLKDVTYYTTGDNGISKINKNLTFQLNGHTLTCKSSAEDGYDRWVTVEANVTFQGPGTVGGSGIDVSLPYTVTLDGGVVVTNEVDVYSTLKVVDATISRVEIQDSENLEMSGGKVNTLTAKQATKIKLSGGEFGIIYRTPSGDWPVTDVPSFEEMLAEGYAYRHNTDNDTSFIKLSDLPGKSSWNDLKNVKVVECPHGYDKDKKDGKCLYCKGHECNHSTSTSDEACTICGMELKTYVAQIGENKYETFKRALEKAETGNTITLLKDVTQDNTDNVCQITKDITLDLGENKLTYTGNYSTVTINGTVTIQNGTVNNSLRVTGGKTTLANRITVSKDVYTDGGELTVDGATISGTLYAGTNTNYPTVAVNVKSGSVGEMSVNPNAKVTLSGGSFSEIMRYADETHGSDGDTGYGSTEDWSKTPTFDQMLAEGYAYQYTSGENKDEFVKLSEINDETMLENVKVVKCTSHSMTGNTCDYCGSQFSVYAKDSSGNGAYFTSVDAAVQASHFNIKLLTDCGGDSDDVEALSMIVDLNGHTLHGTLSMQSSSESSLTVTDSNDAKTGHIDTLKLTTVADIKGGSFGKIESAGYAKLPDGYALATADGSKFKRSDINGTLTNVKVVQCTSHSMGTDGTCVYCKTGSAAKIGETYYATFNEAYAAAQNNDTITLLADVKHGDLDRSITLTIDLNGKTWSSSHSDDNNIEIWDGTYTLKNGTVNGNLYLRYGVSLELGDDFELVGQSNLLDLSSSSTLRVTGDNVEVSGLNVSGCTNAVDCKLEKGTFGWIKADAKNPFSSLLTSGYAFKTTSGNTWYDKYNNDNSDAAEINNVTVTAAPIKSVTVSGFGNLNPTYGYDDNNDERPYFTYTATPGSSESTIAWYVGDEAKSTSESFNFPTGMNAGTYIVKCVVTVDGYSKSDSKTVIVASKALTSDMVSLEQSEFTFKTSYLRGPLSDLVAVTQTPVVNASGLKQDTDYTVSGDESKQDVGDYTLTVTGIGNYSGEVPLSWKITPMKLTIDSFTLNPKTYNGSTEASVDAVKFTGGELIDEPYTATAVFAFANAGTQSYTGTVTLTSGNYAFDTTAGTTTITYSDDGKTATITGTAAIKQADAPDLTATPVEIVYTQTPYTVDLSKAITGMPKDAGTVSYSLNGDVRASISGSTLTFTTDGGTAGDRSTVTVTVSSTNYADATVDVTLKLIDKTPKDLDVTMTGWTYDDTPNAPSYTKPDGAGEATVQYKAKSAADDTYKATVPTNAGEYTVKVVCETNTERYTGTADFTIARKDIKDVTITLDKDTFTYNGSDQKPTVTGVKDGDTPLTKDTDYTVGGQTSGTNADTYTITVTGTGNYTGTADKDWTIGKAPLTIASVTAKNKEYDGSTDATISGVTFGGLQAGQTLTMGTDFTVTGRFTYNALVNKGKDVEATVTLKDTEMTKNYTLNVSTATTKANISQKPITALLSVADKVYDGDTAATVTATVNASDLIEGDEIVISGLTGTFNSADAGTGKTVAIDASGKAITGSGSGNYDVTISATATGTITPATPTGEPKYTAITTSGKKLTDANLTTEGGTFSVAGAVAWADASTTEVQANTAYKWVFTPSSGNYKAIEGTVTLWHKSTSSGGSSSGSTTITVPVSSDHASVTVKAEVSKGNATVEVSDKQIEKVAADGAGNVTLDVSGLKNVDSATVPSHVVEKTNEAENTGLTVALPTGSVTLDETALESVTDNAKGKDVTISVEAVSTSKLPQIVKDVIGMDNSVVAVVDVNVTVNGKKQSTFDGGKITVSVPYTPKKGEDTSKLTVWFIRDDGTIENKGGYYDAKNKCFVFETDHLSQYLLVNTNEAVSFTDVPADAYFASAVNWAAEKGITGGVDATHFMPHNACTRAQIVTFLWRAAGSPEPKAMSTFSDVPANAYYAKAVAWAVENGITGGVTETAFQPNATCTRAHAVAFLFRYAAANGMEAVTLQELVGGYTDAASVPSYALSAFNWALAKGIVNGNNGNLMPNNDCTRAQIVTMLYRLLGE